MQTRSELDRSSGASRRAGDSVSSSSAGRQAFPHNQAMCLQRTIGNQALLGMMRAGRLQAKLTVSNPDDMHEREADRVADDVMRMPDTAVGCQGSGAGNSGIIQTKPG